MIDVLVAAVIAMAHPQAPADTTVVLSLIHISEPTRLLSISYAVFCPAPGTPVDTTVIEKP